MKTTKEVIECLKFHVNKKANEATKMRYKANESGDKIIESFQQGQYMAFNEVYSMLNQWHNYK